MSDEYWTSKVTRIGPHTQEMFDAGLARVKRYRPRGRIEQLQVEKISRAAANQRAGRCGRDEFRLGDVVMRIDEVGEIANKNLAELGHSVVYLNMPKQKLLPGAMKATGDSFPHPQVGDSVAFGRGA